MAQNYRAPEFLVPRRPGLLAVLTLLQLSADLVIRQAAFREPGPVPLVVSQVALLPLHFRSGMEFVG